MDDLLAFLPPAWAHWVRILAEVSFVLSLAAVPIKAALGEPKPGVDPRWKQRIFWCLHFLDFLAANTTPIREKTKRAQSMPPPRPSVPPAMLLLVLPVVLVVGCARSGAPTLHAHAVVADAMGQLIDSAREVIENRLRAAEDSAVAVAETRQEAEALITAIRLRHERLEAAYEVLRVTHSVYADAIVRASAEERDAVASTFPAALAAAWSELVGAAKLVGLILPTPPPALAPLLGGGP